MKLWTIVVELELNCPSSSFVAPFVFMDEAEFLAAKAMCEAQGRVVHWAERETPVDARGLAEMLRNFPKLHGTTSLPLNTNYMELHGHQ